MTERPPVALAAVLAAVVFAAMLLLTGPVQAVAVYGAVAAQVVLPVTGALGRRGTDRAGRLPTFLGVWSGEAGLTYLWAGDDTAASALVYILFGVVFAAVATWILSFAARLDEHDEPARPTDTRPLPVVGADEEWDR